MAKKREPKMGEQRQEVLFKALANRRRLSILRYLKKDGEKSVSDIAEVIGVSIKSTSKHLLILLNANLVSEKKKGFYVLYKIKDDLRQLPLFIVEHI